MKIILSISFSILLANTFYTIVKGFDAKEYVSRQLDADYTIAKGAFFNGISARDKETSGKEGRIECRIVSFGRLCTDRCAK